MKNKGRVFVEDIEVDRYSNEVIITVTSTSPDDDMEDTERLTIKRSSVQELIDLLQKQI